MDNSITVNFNHPANIGILSYLGSRERLEHSVSRARELPSCSPTSVKDPYTKLGSHPDLVTRLWDEVTVKLPVKCQWIVYGTPVLVNPLSGIIFAFCGGTHTYAFRLPLKEHQEAIYAGAKRINHYPAIPSVIKASVLDLDTIGKEWVFGFWLKGEEEWCLAAYNFVNDNQNEAG
jgi:hypothetical protein